MEFRPGDTVRWATDPAAEGDRRVESVFLFLEGKGLFVGATYANPTANDESVILTYANRITPDRGFVGVRDIVLGSMDEVNKVTGAYIRH